MLGGDSSALLALKSAPARAYRELLYRPGGDLSGRIGEQFEVIARPGRMPIDAPRPGDVLITVVLGQRGGGRCVVLTDAGRRRVLDPRHRVPHGQLLLRPRASAFDEIGEQTPGGSGRRQIVIDGTVIDQIWRGNGDVARTFRQLAQTSDLFIARQAYDEAITNRDIPRLATATQLILNQFNVRIAPTNDAAAGQDVLNRNRTNPPLGPADAIVASQARAVGPNAEVWSPDRGFRNNYQGVQNRLGVRVAPESYTVGLASGPGAKQQDYRVGFRLLGMPAVEIDLNGNVLPPGGGTGGGGNQPAGGSGGGAGGGTPPPTYTAGQRVTAAGVLAALAANAIGNKIISHLNERDIRAALARVEAELQAQQANEPNLGILLQFRFKGGVDSGEGPTAEARFQGLSWQRARTESDARAKFTSMDPSATAAYTWIPPLAPETDWAPIGLARFADVSKMEFVRLGFAQIGGFSVKRRSYPAKLSDEVQKWATALRFNVLRPPNHVSYRGVRGGRETESLTLADRQVVDGTVRAIIIDGIAVVPILAADAQTTAFFRATSSIALDHGGVVLEANIDDIRWVRPEQIEMVDGPYARFIQWTKENPDWQKMLPFRKPEPAGDPEPFTWDRYKGRWVPKRHPTDSDVIDVAVTDGDEPDGHEVFERTESAADAEPVTVDKRASTLVVNPFPAPANLPLKTDDSGFITCEDAASRGTDVAHLCAAVCDLTGDPALPPFAAHNPTDMLYVASLAKIYVLYVAFELQARVERRAKAMIAAGLSTAAAGWQAKVFQQLRTEWQPHLDAAFPTLPRGFPKLSEVVALSAAGDATFRESTPPLTDAELDVIGEFGAPRGQFRDWLRLMMRWSNNSAASKCIHALSYPYINGVLASAGFFDQTSKTGLWLSGDYLGNDWVPKNGAGQKLTQRWARLQKRNTTNFAGTAFQVARLMTLLGQRRLVSHAASTEMLRITTGADGIGSYIQSGLASAGRGFLRVFSKIGFGDDSMSHDCAFVRVTDAGDPVTSIKYVAVILGSPPNRSRADLRKLAAAYHDCVRSRHP